MVKNLIFMNFTDEYSLIAVFLLIFMYATSTTLFIVRINRPLYSYYKRPIIFGMKIASILLLFRLISFLFTLIPTKNNDAVVNIFFALAFTLYMPGYSVTSYIYYDFFYYLTSSDEDEILAKLKKIKKYIVFVIFVNFISIIIILLLYELEYLQEIYYIYAFYADLSLSKIGCVIVFLFISSKIKKIAYLKFGNDPSIRITKKINNHVIITIIILSLEVILCNICLYYIFNTNNPIAK